MFEDLKKILRQHLVFAGNFTYEQRKRVQDLKEGTINNITITNSIIHLKRVNAFLGKKQTPKMYVKAVFEVKLKDGINTYSDDIIDIGMDSPERLTAHTKIESLIIKHKNRFFKLFSLITIEKVVFKNENDEILAPNSAEFFLANEMLQEFFNHILFPFYMFEVLGFYGFYQKWLRQSKQKLFLESNHDNKETLYRYISPPVPDKKGDLFFGTDIGEIDYIIKAHKDVYKNVHEAVKKERKFHEYDHNNIYSLKFWVQRYQQPSSYTSWREKILYNTN
jgi:hypothetical protein